MKRKMLLISGSFLLILMSMNLNAQEDTGRPFQVSQPDAVDFVPSIASRLHALPPVDLLDEREAEDGRKRLRHKSIRIVPGKGSTGDDQLAGLQQNISKSPSRTPELVFETASSNSQPTDPSAAVGPNHYIAVTNTAFRIFDKNGTPLTNLLPPNPSIFPSGGCCDLTASYDNVADRWVLSFLGNGAQIAVSNGPDPVNDGWTVYTYAPIVDYQKLSVWHDGYYMSDNLNGIVHVFERDEMLLGNANAQLVSFNIPGWQSDGFNAPQFLNLSHNASISGPATLIHMADDSWASVSQDDHIKLWNISLDWTSPTNSIVTNPTRLGVDASGVADGTVTPFISTFDGGAFNNLSQPGGGPSIDALQWIIMNQAQFRKFPSYNSALFNFVVDTDGGAGELAGVRWYELRQTGDGQPWTIYQEGTYTAPDGRHAWNASMIMDGQGNIGMGYTSMSGPTTPTTVRVGSYYTGQLASNSGTGVMDVAEGLIMAGNANIPGTRYGDYSKIDIDPSNDKKFWFINELMQNGRKNVCGVFQLAPNTNDDVGVISIDTPTDGDLSTAEVITVTVFNFGQNDASGFNVTYQLDGGSIITEAFPGTLASGTSTQFTFTTTVDLSTEGQSYTINSCTAYGIDEDTTNDCASNTMTHLFSNDIGIAEISSPNTGTSLTNETVEVNLQNFGTTDQTGFDVAYTIDGVGPVTETVNQTLPAGGTLAYTFSQTADLSTTGQTYTIEACTNLTADQIPANDCASKDVTNQLCQPTGNCSDGDGVTVFKLGTIDIAPVPCTTGFEDLTNEITDLDRSANNNTHGGILQTSYTFFTEQHFSIWIDFNDNGNFTDAGEQLLDTFVIPQFTSDTDQPFSITIPTNAPLGIHTLRVRGFFANGDGTLNDPCGDLEWGNTIDVSVNIVDSTLSVDNFQLNNADLKVISQPDNQFEIVLNTASTEDLSFNLFNMLGQQLVYNVMKPASDGSYRYNLDMSYASSGTYIVKIGRGKSYRTAKLIVR